MLDGAEVIDDGGQAMRPDVDPFDPAQEHSASATRNALAEGVERAMGVRRPQNPRTRPAYNRTQLAQLGLPEAEISILEQNDPNAYRGA
jgi:hypothetical protein